jgi:glycosyltransferase involved in cell wall biosynthesis
MAGAGPALMACLRVLHVIPSVSPRDGGATRAHALMERALSEAGAQVTTLTTDHDFGPLTGPGAPTAPSGVRRIYAHKWLTPYKVAPGLVPRLVQAVREHDVVHIHALFSFASTAAAWAARRSGVPYVVHPIGTLSGYGLRTRRPWLKSLSLALVERPMLQAAAAVHFTSRPELDEAQATGLPMPRATVIPLGVDAAEDADIRQSAAGAELQAKVPAGRRILLFLSRLDPKKNLEAVIDAVALSPVLRASCTLLVAGAGEAAYVAALQRRAAAAGVADITVWLGHIDGAHKRAALAAADVFVLPSFSENFCIAAIEALLAGVPCVLGQGVAVADTIEKAGAGAVTDPEATAVAGALERILAADAALKDLTAERARSLAAREFSTALMAQRLIALYTAVAGAPPSRAQREAPPPCGSPARSPAAPLPSIDANRSA